MGAGGRDGHTRDLTPSPSRPRFLSGTHYKLPSIYCGGGTFMSTPKHTHTPAKAQGTHGERTERV